MRVCRQNRPRAILAKSWLGADRKSVVFRISVLQKEYRPKMKAKSCRINSVRPAFSLGRTYSQMPTVSHEITVKHKPIYRYSKNPWTTFVLGVEEELQNGPPGWRFSCSCGQVGQYCETLDEAQEDWVEHIELEFCYAEQIRCREEGSVLGMADWLTQEVMIRTQFES